MRAATQAEADKRIGGVIAHTWFVEGAVFGAALVTPSREQLIEVLRNHQHDYCEECDASSGCTCGWKHHGEGWNRPGEYSLSVRDDDPIKSVSEHQADVLLALMGVVQGEPV